MMNTFKFIISTPDGNLFEEEIVKVTLRGADGDLAVMAKHIPFITSVKPCDCVVELPDAGKKILSLERGILSVNPDCVTLMSGSAKWIEKDGKMQYEK